MPEVSDTAAKCCASLRMRNHDIVWCDTHEQPVYACSIQDRERRLAEIAQIIDEAMREDGYTAVIKVRDRERIRQLAKGTEKC